VEFDRLTLIVGDVVVVVVVVVVPYRDVPPPPPPPQALRNRINNSDAIRLNMVISRI